MRTKYSFYPPVTPKLFVEFRDENNNLIDPTTVIFKLKDPANVITSYTVGTDQEAVRESVGTYSFKRIFTTAEAGEWRWHVEGDQIIASTGVFTILASQF